MSKKQKQNQGRNDWETIKFIQSLYGKEAISDLAVKVDGRKGYISYVANYNDYHYGWVVRRPCDCSFVQVFWDKYVNYNRSYIPVEYCKNHKSSKKPVKNIIIVED